jgi:hypothetical protein
MVPPLQPARPKQIMQILNREGKVLMSCLMGVFGMKRKEKVNNNMSTTEFKVRAPFAATRK